MGENDARHLCRWYWQQKLPCPYSRMKDHKADLEPRRQGVNKKAGAVSKAANASKAVGGLDVFLSAVSSGEAQIAFSQFDNIQQKGGLSFLPNINSAEKAQTRAARLRPATLVPGSRTTPLKPSVPRVSGLATLEGLKRQGSTLSRPSFGDAARAEQHSARTLRQAVGGASPTSSLRGSARGFIQDAGAQLRQDLGIGGFRKKLSDGGEAFGGGGLPYI